MSHIRSAHQLLSSHADDDQSCASCQATEDLLPDEGAGIVFCTACVAPIADLPFAEYYLDLGCGD